VQRMNERVKVTFESERVEHFMRVNNDAGILSCSSTVLVWNIHKKVTHKNSKTESEILTDEVE